MLDAFDYSTFALAFVAAMVTVSFLVGLMEYGHSRRIKAVEQRLADIQKMASGLS